MRYFTIGLLVFLSLGVALAPASLITTFAPVQPPVALLNTRGTIWQGQADVLVESRSVGILRWAITPWSLLGLRVNADWQLDQTLAQLYGQISVRSQSQISANGTIQARAINEWLNAYDIDLEGDFEVTDLVAELAADATSLEHLAGTIYWSGGRVRFTLAGLLQDEILPPLVTSLDMVEGRPRAVVVAEGDSIPLIIVQEGVPGYIKVGVTKRFTDLVNRPWPGTHAAHTIVVEVEERVFN